MEADPVEIGKWVSARFVRPAGPMRKTDVYVIFNHSNIVILGEIRWHAPFRQYSFMPVRDRVFSASCMHDIGNFCAKLTKEHNERNRAKRKSAAATVPRQTV